MNDKNDHPDLDDFRNPTKRVSEILRLFASVRRKLEQAVAEIGAPQSSTPKAIISKLSELQTAHISALKAEEAFHDAFASQSQADSIDFDAIRDDLGRRLDRIRAAVDSE